MQIMCFLFRMSFFDMFNHCGCTQEFGFTQWAILDFSCWMKCSNVLKLLLAGVKNHFAIGTLKFFIATSIVNMLFESESCLKFFATLTANVHSIRIFPNHFLCIFFSFLLSLSFLFRRIIFFFQFVW